MRSRTILFLVLVLSCITLSADCAVKPSNAWKFIGPLQIDPQVIHFDPSNPSRVYMLANSTRLYRSDDRGNTWQLPDSPGRTEAGTLNESAIWRQGRTANDFSVAPNGVLYAIGTDWVRSNDGGKSWLVLPKPTESNAISVAAANAETVLVGAADGIYRSSNGGRTWSNVHPADPAALRDPQMAVRPRAPIIAVHPRDNKLVFAVSPEPPLTQVGVNTYKQLPNSILRSTDAGRSWSKAGDFPGNVLAVALDPSDPKVLYCTSNEGLYKSVDKGATFAKIDTAGRMRLNSNSIAIDPDLPKTLYAMMSEGPAVSRDAGAHWVSIPDATGIDPRPTAVAVSNKVVLFADNLRMFRSTDQGVKWSRVGDYFTHAHVSDVSVDHSTLGGLYVFSGWNVYHSVDQGKTWLPIKMWPSMHQAGTRIATFPQYPKTLIAFTRDQVGISVDSGANWETHDLPKVNHWQVPAVDPGNPNRMYIGDGQDVFSTEDSGQNWTRHQVLPSNVSHIRVSTIAVSPVDGAVFVGTSPPGALDAAGGKISSHTRELAELITYKSADAGMSWEALPGSGEKFDFYDWIRVLTADPKNPNILYAGGAAGIRRSTFLKSVNGGESWTYWNDSPVHAWITSIVVDPQDTGCIYVGTYTDGVFVSTDGGDTWTKSIEGLPASASSSTIPTVTLTIDAREPKHLYVVTQDGLFARTL
ncbi:MAG TPA: hypothetical protein VGK34_08110 [Armatimonadota bacterium]|jgi:photosystem II stability/assembly factor-like uncharacterized protein